MHALPLKLIDFNFSQMNICEITKNDELKSYESFRKRLCRLEFIYREVIFISGTKSQQFFMFKVFESTI